MAPLTVISREQTNSIYCLVLLLSEISGKYEIRQRFWNVTLMSQVKDQYRYHIWHNMTKKLPVWSSKSSFSLIYGNGELNKFLFVKLIVISASFFVMLVRISKFSQRSHQVQIRSLTHKSDTPCGCGWSRPKTSVVLWVSSTANCKCSKQKLIIHKCKEVMNNMWNYISFLEKLVLSFVCNTVLLTHWYWKYLIVVVVCVCVCVWWAGTGSWGGRKVLGAVMIKLERLSPLPGAFMFSTHHSCVCLRSCVYQFPFWEIILTNFPF